MSRSVRRCGLVRASGPTASPSASRRRGPHRPPTGPPGPPGSQQSGAQSEDSQLTLNIAANVIPAHPPDTSVRVHIEPLDPATLGPVPPEFRPNGNGYRITFTYMPSGTPATAVNPP